MMNREVLCDGYQEGWFSSMSINLLEDLGSYSDQRQNLYLCKGCEECISEIKNKLTRKKICQ